MHCWLLKYIIYTDGFSNIIKLQDVYPSYDNTGGVEDEAMRKTSEVGGKVHHNGDDLVLLLLKISVMVRDESIKCKRRIDCGFNNLALSGVYENLCI